MTSSKSFRAAVMPSSFSLPSVGTHLDPDLNSNNPPRKLKSQRLSKLLLPQEQSAHEQQNQQSLPRANLSRRLTTRLLRAVKPRSSPTSKQDNGEPVPLFAMQNSKPKTWSNRLSSHLPMLITPNTDLHSQQSISRKPISPVDMPSSERSASSPPPPPYAPPEAPTLDSATIGLAITPDSVPPQPTTPAPPIPSYISIEAPTISLDLPDFSISEDAPPQIMAPIPPSPEVKRETVANVEPAAVAASHQSSASTDGEYFSTATTLQNNNNNNNKNKDMTTRSSSLQQAEVVPTEQHVPTSQTSPTPDQRGRRTASTQISSTVRDQKSGSRGPASLTARPASAVKDGSSQSPTRGRIRRSWMPGGNRSRSNSIDVQNTGNSQAWIISEETQAEYNPSFLNNGEKVPELWNENGAVLVYLYPRGSGCGPSFKVPEFTVSSSYIFNELIQSEQESPVSARSRARSFGGRDSLSVQDASRVMSPPMSPDNSSGDLRLYLPIAPPTATGQLHAPGEGSQAELDRLIGIRNLFAFLTGQPLVGTKTQPTVFSAFLQIAALLQEFGFTSVDGTGFGNAVDLSFGFYSDQHGFADCRHSREKTLEALVLGERMRSMELYNEAFAHAAGKYSAIVDLQLPLFEQVTLHTRQRLERSYLDLVNRQHNANEHLEQFDFPSMFSGIASSTSAPELRQVRFKIWRNSYSRMRQFILSYYKTTFGNWPPKASSKKNPFAESGLNRLVLKVLYSDMCALYDLLVDRTNLTSRVMDEVPALSGASDKITTSALRNILSEFDRSKPPVLPPIPFDLPQLPSMTSVVENFKSLSVKDQAKYEKKIKENELILILNKGYNFDTSSSKLPFLDQFKEFEIREGRGKVAHDLADQRIGYWIFMYAVLQSLPMLVVDAPGVKFTDGTEYFLCEPPMGNLPWIEDRQVRKMWYEVAGSGGLVELSTDAVMYSVEATYHRSHCWLAAKRWEGIEGADAPPPEEPAMSPLEPPRVFQSADGILGGPPSVPIISTPSPPPGVIQPALRPRNLSPAARGRVSSGRSSIAMGLEPVPLEAPNAFGSHNRSSSLGPRPPSSHLNGRSISTSNLSIMGRDIVETPQSATAGTTFDDILGQPDKKVIPKKKSRFF